MCVCFNRTCHGSYWNTHIVSWWRYATGQQCGTVCRRLWTIFLYPVSMKTFRQRLKTHLWWPPDAVVAWTPGCGVSVSTNISTYLITLLGYLGRLHHRSKICKQSSFTHYAIIQSQYRNLQTSYQNFHPIAILATSLTGKFNKIKYSAPQWKYSSYKPARTDSSKFLAC